MNVLKQLLESARRYLAQMSSTQRASMLAMVVTVASLFILIVWFGSLGEKTLNVPLNVEVPLAQYDNVRDLLLQNGISAVEYDPKAQLVLVPEKELDFEKDVVERIRESRLAGNTHFMIVVAEGVGSAVDIARQIEEAVGISPRVTVLGHIQRGGSPNARDRETATRMGYYAATALAEGRCNCIIGTQEGSIVEIPIEEALAMKKRLQMDRYRIMEIMQFGEVMQH